MALSKETIGNFIKKINLNDPSRFKGKLYDATKGGELKNFGDNREALEKVLKERHIQIKRGQYDPARQNKDYRAMLGSGELTKEDQKEVRQLLNAFGDKSFQKPPAPKVPQSSAKPTAQSRPWRPWEKMPSFLTKNQPYNPSTGSASLASPSSPSSSPKINPPRLIK